MIKDVLTLSISCLDVPATSNFMCENLPFSLIFLADWMVQTPYNYHRALVWTAVMTALSHLDPNFSTVVGIEAMNEPITNAAQTPGLGECKSHAFDTRDLCLLLSEIPF